ncbi:hypothetical protein [Saccharopolyspora shandongensis]|uniref:hypothetical protein n=1 Tax=Saccharopolyspora shandongensis TaxID=418495 RepID=UPI0033F91CB7
MPEPQQIIERIAESIAAAAPRGWSSVSVTVRASVLVQEFAVTVRTSDGGSPGMDTPAAVKADFAELRPLMYEPGRGTWFSATLTVTAPDQHSIDFNYDRDPQWWPDLPPVVFSSDLAEFPRDAAHIPPWLAEKLERAAADGAALDAAQGGESASGTEPPGRR